MLPTLPLPVLLLAMLLVSVANSTFTKLEPYYVSAVGNRGSGPGMLMVVSSLGVAGAQPFWLWLSRAARNPARYAPFLLMLVALVLFGALAPLGIQAQFGGAFLFGIAEGGIGQVIWTAYANSVNARARARDTLAFGVFTGIGKLGIALSAVMVGGAVATAGRASDRTAALLLAMLPLPMLCIAAALLLLMLVREKT